MTLSLALWIGLLPVFSAIHLAMVPHVYWSEHGHLHEVVTVGDSAPVEDANRATASIYDQSSAYSFASLEECPFVDLAIRQGVVTSGWLPPNLFDNTGWQIFTFSNFHVLRPILDRAPKHSPPIQTA
jgi:hypothetical protein